jgi:hypothetical protein
MGARMAGLKDPDGNNLYLWQKLQARGTLSSLYIAFWTSAAARSPD